MSEGTTHDMATGDHIPEQWPVTREAACHLFAILYCLDRDALEGEKSD